MVLHDTRRIRPGRAGFTLMEVLVVVAILVILAGVGGVTYMRYLDDAKINQAQLQIKNIENAVMGYYIKYSEYPPSLAALTQPMPDGSKPYLETTAIIDPWNQPYMYQFPGQHHMATQKPDIWSNGQPGASAAPIGNWDNRNAGM